MPRWRRGVSPEVYREIRTKYASGESARSIAELYGLPTETIHRYVVDIVHTPRHGCSGSQLHRIWGSMIQRCTNPNAPNYHHYGGRGIKVCSQWRNSFTCFREWALKNGYSPTEAGRRNVLTLDRIDVDGNYEPKNCRFVDQHIQLLNQRPNPRNATGYSGVSFENRIQKYRSEITIRGKTVFLGYFSSALEAAEARDVYIKEHELTEYKLQTKKAKDAKI